MVHSIRADSSVRAREHALWALLEDCSFVWVLLLPSLVSVGIKFLYLAALLKVYPDQRSCSIHTYCF